MVKKVLIITLVLVTMLGINSYALETSLFDMRNRILDESKDIKTKLKDSKDAVLLNSMWDTCLITINQLDAYFFMLSIFNTIRKEDLNELTINYLISWLNAIKDTNGLNLKNLKDMKVALEPNTKVYVERLKTYFKDLTQRIDAEINKVGLFKQSLKQPKK